MHNTKYILMLMGGLGGKYAKEILTAIEELGPLDPRVRKIVLDGFGNMNREVQKKLAKEETAP